MKQDYDTQDFTDGLPLFNGKEDEGFFSKIGIIVWNREEAARIQEELTGYYLAGSNNYGAIFSRTVIENSFVIILDEVVRAVENGGKLQAQTIEGLDAAQLLHPIKIHKHSTELDARINAVWNEAKAGATSAARDYLHKNPSDLGSCAHVNVITHDITNPIVQQMLLMEIAHGPFDGKVVIYPQGEWPHQQSADFNACVAEAIEKILNDKLAKIFLTEEVPD